MTSILTDIYSVILGTFDISSDIHLYSSWNVKADAGAYYNCTYKLQTRI